MSPPIDSAKRFDQSASEAFARHSHVRVLDLDGEHALAHQPALPALANHVGVRHASALHAAACEAARALVWAALDACVTPASARLLESEIAYTNVGVGALSSAAQPTGEGWKTLGAALAAGTSVALKCAVTTTNVQGKEVVKLSCFWLAEPHRDGVEQMVA